MRRRETVGDWEKDGGRDSGRGRRRDTVKERGTQGLFCVAAAYIVCVLGLSFMSEKRVT